MFDNWDAVRSYLVDKIGISNDVALTLSQAKIDMIPVFMKERRALSLREIICSPAKLGDMLNFNGGRTTTPEEISSTVCQLDDSQTRDVAIMLLKNLNFDYIFRTVSTIVPSTRSKQKERKENVEFNEGRLILSQVMSANVKSILANANLTETEGKMVLDNLGVAAELLPFFKDKLSSPRLPTAEALETDAQEPDQTTVPSKFSCKIPRNEINAASRV